MLVGAALLVSVFFVEAFLLAGKYRIKPAWIFFGIASLAFFPTVIWDYREKLQSINFALFSLAWALAHGSIFVVVMTYFDWEYWIAALFVELFLFYAVVYWLFGLNPPTRPDE